VSSIPLSGIHPLPLEYAEYILARPPTLTLDSGYLFQALAVKEGERILAEALTRFPVKHALCIHRVGSLDLTEMAVWVGVSAAHRGEAFDACRFIIDEVKHRVPIWKKEHYRNGDSGWVNCERCAAAPHHSHDHGHNAA